MKSTAARKVEPQAAIAKRGLTDVSLNAVVVREGETTPKAGTQALHVDTILKPGRPSTGFDKKAYNRQYMRDRRAKQKQMKEAM